MGLFPKGSVHAALLGSVVSVDLNRGLPAGHKLRGGGGSEKGTLLTVLHNKQEIVWEYGAEVDKGGAGLMFGVRSSVVLEATWGGYLEIRSFKWEGALWVLDSKGGMQHS